MKNNPNIIFLNHASFIIEFNGVKILNDPFLFGSAFNNGWNLIKEVDHEKILKGITHIFFSHEHPDHFSIPFLKSIPLDKRGEITIIYQETWDKRVKDFCEKSGYKFLEFKNLKETKIIDDLYITIGKSPFYDSWINYRLNNKNILNVNDCIFENKNILSSIKKVIKNIDILFTQFSYANFILEKDQVNEAINCLNSIKLQDRILGPNYIIPFASYIYFSHHENYFMNKNMNTIQAAHNFIEKNCKAHPIVLKPNEYWDLKKKENHDSLDFWNVHYENIPNLQYSKNSLIVNSEDLIEKSKYYIKKIKKNNNVFLIFILFKLKIFSKILIFVKDLEKYFYFDIFNGLQLKKNLNDKNNIDIEMSSDSLELIFKYDYGFDTLLVNARFKALPKNLNKVTKTFIIGSLNNTGRFLNFFEIHKYLNLNLIKRALKLFNRY